MMERVAFIMRLKPGKAAEYEKRHDEIWPDLVEELRSSGLSDFDIYLAEDGITLFATHLFAGSASEMSTTVEDGATAPETQPGGPVQRRWWTVMAPLMEVNNDDSPKAWPLKRVFHMD